MTTTAYVTTVNCPDGSELSSAIGSPFNLNKTVIVAGDVAKFVFTSAEISGVDSVQAVFSITVNGVTKTETITLLASDVESVVESTQPYLTSPLDGDTLNSGTVTLEYNAGFDAPANRQYDHHGSASPQPVNDATVGNDIYDSVGIGSVLSFSASVPQNGATIYGRIRYSDNDWSDADTTIADGRFVDYVLTENTAAAAGYTALHDFGTPLIADMSFAEQVARLDDDGWMSSASDSSLAIVEHDGLEALQIELATGTAAKPSSRLISRNEARISATDVTLTQKIYIPSANQMGGTAKSGKFGTGVYGTYEIVASGGDRVPNSCSLRPAFNDNGASGNPRLIAYLYAASAVTGQYGEEIPLWINGAEVEVPRDQWFEYTVRMKTNGYGSTTDILQVWLDGEIGIDRSDISYFISSDNYDGSSATGRAAEFNQFLISHSYGGYGTAYIAPSDEISYITGAHYRVDA